MYLDRSAKATACKDNGRAVEPVPSQRARLSMCR